MTGVACFILDRRYAVMGAQPPEVIAGVVEKAAAMAQPAAGP